MRNVTDKEALEDFEKSIVGLDLDNIVLTNLSIDKPYKKSLRDILKAMKKELKNKEEKSGDKDIIGDDKLRKQKNWIKYKIEQGWIT